MAKRFRKNHSDRADTGFRVLLLVSLAIGVSRDVPGQTPANVSWCGASAESQQVPGSANALPTEQLRNATLRQPVHLSIAGSLLRVRLSSAFGTQPLHIVEVHVARPLSAAGAAIDPISDRPLIFAGAGDVTIPAGAEYVSDAIEYPTKSLSNLAISLLYDAPPERETSHPGSHATSDVVSGNHLKDASLPAAIPVEHWFQLSGVDVAGGARQEAIVALGDSITDGHGSTTNEDDRCPDNLAAHLQKAHSLGVLDEGIDGNRLLLNGLGPNVISSFDRDGLTSVLWDFEQPRQDVSNHPFFTKVLPTATAEPITLCMLHLKPSRTYLVAIYRTDYKANDAYTAYLEMSAPNELNPAQIAHLNDLTHDQPETDQVSNTEPDRSITLHVPMLSNNIVLASVTHTAQKH